MCVCIYTYISSVSEGEKKNNSYCNRNMSPSTFMWECLSKAFKYTFGRGHILIYHSVLGSWASRSILWDWDFLYLFRNCTAVMDRRIGKVGAGEHDHRRNLVRGILGKTRIWVLLRIVPTWDWGAGLSHSILSAVGERMGLCAGIEVPKPEKESTREELQVSAVRSKSC